MSTMLIVLLLACALAIVHNVAPSNVKTRKFGVEWNMGPRDENPGEVPPLAGRLERARVNYHENFVIFVALALALEITGRANGLGNAAAALWLASRVIYLPLYAAGTPKIRTLVWSVSLLGLVLMAGDLLR